MPKKKLEELEPGSTDWMNALSALSPAEQAALISARSQELLPSAEDLASQLATARGEGRRLVVKFGIDPTAADVHVGHAVPMIIASRLGSSPLLLRLAAPRNPVAVRA